MHQSYFVAALFLARSLHSARPGILILKRGTTPGILNAFVDTCIHVIYISLSRTNDSNFIAQFYKILFLGLFAQTQTSR